MNRGAWGFRSDPHPHDLDHDAAEVRGPHRERGDGLHACMDGWVFVGYIVTGEDGDEEELVVGVPRKRCQRLDDDG